MKVKAKQVIANNFYMILGVIKHTLYESLTHVDDAFFFIFVSLRDNRHGRIPTTKQLDIVP